MAEIKKTEENIDKIKLLASVKDDSLPKLINVVKEQKRRLDQIARAFEDIKRKKEQQAVQSAEIVVEEVKEQEKPKLPKKGRLVNGQFIALPAPTSAPIAPKKNKKKLIQLTDQQKQQMKIAAAQFVTKKIMAKVKK